MNREEKSALSRQKILDAAMEEFSRNGYEGASLNTVWAQKGISKGIIYHHFRDKDELYLLCVKCCFDEITGYLQNASENLTGTASERLKDYFDARIRFFSEHPEYLGIFLDASFQPPKKLFSRIVSLRQGFDTLNVSVLSGLLEGEHLRKGLTVDLVVDDFRMYMDYFNLHFKSACTQTGSPEELFREHEERCHRQLDILLYGVLNREK